MRVTEEELLQKGIEVLEEIGLRTQNYEPTKSSEFDHVLRLTAPKTGKSKKYFVEVKKHVNNASVSQWILSLQTKGNIPNDLVLLSDYISPSLGERLREMEISYFDTAGNAYFNDPAFYIYITGKKPKESRQKPVSLFRPAGIRLLLHLLTQPGLEERDYREIAEHTGVPKSTVGELMGDLEKRKFLIYSNKKRRLANKEDLLKRWVEAFTESYRPKLVRGRFIVPDGKANWWDDVAIVEFEACWGGEVAAQKLVGHIKPRDVTIYADSLLPKLQAEHRLRRDPKGDIEILKKFWTDELDNIAPPLVVYADLIASGNDRDLETAQMIYERYLARLVEDSSE